MKFIPFVAFLFLFFSCKQKEKDIIITENHSPIATAFAEKLSNAALSIINPSIEYDPAYFSIEYPNGDIPKTKVFVQMLSYDPIEN